MPTTWNPADRLNTTLSGGDLIATATASTGGVRSLGSVTSGKYYWEVTTANYSSIFAGIGIGNASASLSGSAFNAANVAMTIQNGNCYVNGTGVGSINSVSTLYCFALDMGTKRYWVRNGATGSWNANSGTANDPATGVGGFDVSSILGGATPALAMALFGGSGMAATANFAGPFTGAVPGGYTPGFGPVSAGAEARAMILA